MPKNHSDNPYFSIAFYNLENLFDTVDNPYTNDDHFLPDAERRWTPKRYKKKLRKLGYTISKISASTTKKPPVVVGLAEVENQQVVQDLIATKFLSNLNYGVVHYDSPDERGIDVALIYNKHYFSVLHSEVYGLELFDAFGAVDHTRDILLVKGELNGELIYFLVNHWPSRRQGEKETEPKRIKAAQKVIEIIEGIKASDTSPKIIVMGDFNDDPFSPSIKSLVHKCDLYNPMEKLTSYSRGSLGHERSWFLFDQILFSTNFFEFESGQHNFSKAEIFDEGFLKQFKGNYKNFPFRTFVGRKYKGGYSDHFPVYLQLKKAD